MKWKSIIFFPNRDLLIHKANSILFHFGESERSTFHLPQLLFTPLLLSLFLSPTPVLYLYCVQPSGFKLTVTTQVCGLQNNCHIYPWSRITAAILSLWGCIFCPLRPELSICIQSHFPHFRHICVRQTNWNDNYSCGTMLNGWWQYKCSYSDVYLWMCSRLISPTVSARNITGKVCVCFLIPTILQRREVLHLR